MPTKRTRSQAKSESPPDSCADLQKKRIMRSAAKLFAKNSYAATSLDDIAEDLGATKGTIYHYFESKRELLFEARMFVLEPFMETMQAIVDGPQLTVDEKMRQAIRSHIATFLADQAVMHFLLHAHFKADHALSPADRRTVDRRRNEYIKLFERIVGEGVATGVFRTLNVGVAAKTTIGAATWVAHWFKPSGSLSITELSEVIVDFIMASLLARPVTTQAEEEELALGTARDGQGALSGTPE